MTEIKGQENNTPWTNIFFVGLFVVIAIIYWVYHENHSNQLKAEQAAKTASAYSACIKNSNANYYYQQANLLYSEAAVDPFSNAEAAANSDMQAYQNAIKSC